MSFYEDHAGRSGFSTPRTTALQFDRQTRRLTRIPSKDHPEPADGVITMLEDRDQALWTGRNRTGFSSTIVIVTNSSGIATILRIRRASLKTVSRPLPGFGGSYLGRWVRRSRSNFSPRRFLFTKLPFDSGNPANLGETFVNVIYEDSQRNLWTEQPER